MIQHGPFCSYFVFVLIFRLRSGTEQWVSRKKKKKQMTFGLRKQRDRKSKKLDSSLVVDFKDKIIWRNFMAVVVLGNQPSLELIILIILMSGGWILPKVVNVLKKKW